MFSPSTAILRDDRTRRVESVELEVDLPDEQPPEGPLKPMVSYDIDALSPRF